MPDESETMSGRPRDPEEAAKRERPRVSAFLLLVERFDERLMPGTRFQGESARASRSIEESRASGRRREYFLGPFRGPSPPSSRHRPSMAAATERGPCRKTEKKGQTAGLSNRGKKGEGEASRGQKAPPRNFERRHSFFGPPGFLPPIPILALTGTGSLSCEQAPPPPPPSTA